MIRGFQWDLARQVERLDWLLAQLPRYAEWGYQELYLHLEDAVEFPSLPAVARADAYSQRQLGQLVDAAHRVGINVVPIVNLLGHTQYLIKVPELRDLNELRAPDGSPLPRGQICPVHPRTLEIAGKLLRDVRPFCSAGKVHVGLDESFHLGRHPLSRREIDEIGLAAHFAGYVGRLRQLTISHGLRLGMWADMLYFLPGAIRLLPRDIAAYEWYYYPFRRRPRVELFNFAESAVGERLIRHGIEYWGCPMNGAFRFEPLPHFTDRLDNALSWWRRCRALQASGFLMTSWEPYRLAQELTTVVDAAVASLWLTPGRAREHGAMLEEGFARVFGRAGARAAARAALSADRYPFSGYPRWQINQSWETVSRRDPVEPYRRELRHFADLLRRAGPDVPAPLRASLEFRHYLAERDVYVRAGGQRPSFALGRRAARAMWVGTRHPRQQSPNEAIVDADVRRRRPVGWKLCYRVENVAPAVQLVGVEQRGPNGKWELRQSCHTIEFQGAAARPRGGFAREHAAPVDWEGDMRAWPELRIVVRGIGRVRIADVALAHAGMAHPAHGSSWTLGQPAPKRGFPRIDWTKNRATLPLRFGAVYAPRWPSKGK